MATAICLFSGARSSSITNELHLQGRLPDNQPQDRPKFHEVWDILLIWLGDVIAQPDWLPRSNAVSIGDLLLSTGLAGWVFLAALEGRQKRRGPARTLAYIDGPPG